MSLPRASLSHTVYVAALVAPLACALVYGATLQPADGMGVPVPVLVSEASEEPLACEQAPAPQPRVVAEPQAPADGAGALMPLIPGGKVVVSMDVDRGWGVGKVRHASEQLAEFSGARRADVARLPGELQALLGQAVDIYGPNGRVCTARLARSAELLVRYSGEGYPYLDTDEEFEDFFEDGKLPRGTIAQVYRDYEPVLATQLIPDAGESCEGGVWARSAHLAAPTVLVEVEPRGPEVEAMKEARRRIRRSAGYREMKTNYEEYQADVEGELDWRRFIRRHFSTALWRDVSGEHEVVYARIGDFDSSCGDGFGWGQTHLRRLDDSWREDVAALGYSDALVGVVDADGDGQLELIFDTPLGPSVSSASDDLKMEAAVWWDGCPC